MEKSLTFLDHDEVDKLGMILGRMGFDKETKMWVALCQHPVVVSSGIPEGSLQDIPHRLLDTLVIRLVDEQH